MKIGPLDIGVKILALAAAVVVVIMLDIRFFVSNHGKRIEGFYSYRIPSYLVPETQRSLEDGAGECGFFLKVMPKHAGARLYLATMRLGLNEYEKAEEVFKSVANDSTVSDELRAMGTYGVGASLFSRRPEQEQTEGAEDAATWFVKALEIDPGLADAKVALCCAVEWRLRAIEGKADTAEGKATLEEVAGWLAKASGEAAGRVAATLDAITAKELELLDSAAEGKHPPGLAGTSQYYNVRGLVMARARKLREAEKSFDAAIALRPRWEVPTKNQFRTMIELLPDTDVKLSIREHLLNKYTGRISRRGEDGRRAMVAFAVAWFNTRKVARTEDYRKVGYQKALELLKRAYDKNNDPEAMLSAVAVMDERLFAPPERGGELAKISKEFLLPCPEGAAANRWTGDPAANTPRKKKTPALRKALAPVYGLATAMKSILADCSSKARFDAKTAAEVKLRLLACDLLIALATLADDQQSLHTVQPQRAREIKAQHSDNPDAQIAYAHYMLRTGNYAEAGAALRRAYELGAKTEEMKKIIEVISATPKLIQPRPDKRGWFGQRPLIRATLWSPNSPGQMTSGSMSFNETKVTARIVGGQILHLLPEGRITDGKHTIKIEAVDGYGNQAELEFGYAVDKIGPKVTVSPGSNTAVKGPHPVWTISLSDEGTGVDLASIQVRLNNAGDGAAPVRTLLIDNGIFKEDIPSVPAKRGDRVTTETFKVGSRVSLTPGSYQLRVFFADQAGNEKEQNWTFRVQ